MVCFLITFRCSFSANWSRILRTWEVGCGKWSTLEVTLIFGAKFGKQSLSHKFASRQCSQVWLRFKIGIIRPKELTDWINIFWNAISGKVHKSPNYDLLTGDHIEITPQHKMPYQCDGNVFPSTKKLVIDVYPQALSVKL